MKLLKKQTVQLEVQRERKNQIDEGISLAQKIDALRITKSELESQHQKFIDGMQKELKDQIDPLLDTIAGLHKDIEILENKQTELLLPLDGDFKLIIERKTAEITSKSIELDSKIKLVTDKEKKLTELGRELKYKNTQSNTRERELDKAIIKSHENIYISEQAKKESLRLKEETEESIAIQTQQILDKEAGVAVREREAQILKSQVEEKEKQLTIKEILLQDREQTLEREYKRNGKLISL